MQSPITKLFVLSNPNTFPTSGSTQNLLEKQFGVFLPNYTPAAAGTSAAAKYLYLAQGRPTSAPHLPSKKTEKIYKDLVTDWYKVPAKTANTVQVTEIKNWNLKCDQSISVTLRAFSNYINVTHTGGMVRGVVVNTPCCDCDSSDVCTPLSDADTLAVVQEIAQKLNADKTLSPYVTATVTGTTVANIKLVLTAAAPKVDPPSWNLDVNGPWQDVIQFYAWVKEGGIMTEPIVADSCTDLADVVKTATGSFKLGTSEDIKRMERLYYRYDNIDGALNSDPDYNPFFTSNVVDGQFYTTYFINFKLNEDPSFGMRVPYNNSVIIAVQNSDTTTQTALEAILNPALGTVKNMAAAADSAVTYHPIVP